MKFDFNQVWLVEAKVIGEDSDLDDRCFVWTFFEREYANHACNMGEKRFPNMRWSMTVVPFGSLEHALHDINTLRLED